VYDLELPNDFVPFNGDGEVEEFILMPIQEALQSIRYMTLVHMLYLLHSCVLRMRDSV
jgi:hypothetical protein